MKIAHAEAPRKSLLFSIEKRLKRFMPPRLKSALVSIVPAQLSWKREDPNVWPMIANSDKHRLESYEYSLFSQNGEDGILRFLFSIIGFSSKQFLEFGFATNENNSLRLILKENFSGVFIDCSVKETERFNRAATRYGISDVRAIDSFLDLDNLENVIHASGLSGEIDLLSIDVDGNDYWFWEKLTSVTPRVAVIEYNASLGPDLSVAIPYDPRFNRFEREGMSFYHGASLAALARLGTKKGYGLVGCDSSGANAFFVRNDCLVHGLKALPAREAFRPHQSRLERGFTAEDQFRLIRDMPFLVID